MPTSVIKMSHFLVLKFAARDSVYMFTPTYTHLLGIEWVKRFK